MSGIRFTGAVRDTLVRGALAVGLYAAFPAFSDVYRLWRRAAGDEPGRGLDPFEYPPLSALYFGPVAHLPNSTTAVVINGLVMVGCAVLITVLLERLASADSRVSARIWVASPALLFLLPINWDVLVALIAMVSVIAVTEDRVLRSGLLTGVGTALKIAPGALVPPLVVLIRGWRQRTRFLASGFLVLAAAYLANVLLAPTSWRFHLDFASVRTDFDSTVWALLEQGARLFGGAMEIGAINAISTIALAVALVLTSVWAHRHQPRFIEAAALAMIALVALNKVYKPQYVLWLLPLIAWLGLSSRKTRALELTAIVQFTVIYFDLPKELFLAEGAIRFVVLALLAREVVTRAERSTPVGIRATTG